jgi:phosphate uptake regulator
MVQMESRKLQKVGYSTLSVSLPSRWIKDNGLKRGDLIFFKQDEDGALKVYPNEFAKPQEEAEEYMCNADLCVDPKMMERVIVGNYILGREIFSIISSERMRSEHVEEIRDIIRKLIGLGIVVETPDRITLQCSIDPRKFQIDMLLRRLSLISLTIVKESVQALGECNESLAQDAINREDEADTMCLLAMRLLVSAQRKREVAEAIGLTDPLYILYFGLMLRYLELIADYAEENARRAITLLSKYKDKLPRWVIDRIVNLNDLAHDLVTKSVDAFFIADIKIANSLLEMLTFIKLERSRLMGELPEVPHLRGMLWDINKIADMAAGIALIAINNTLEKKTKICSKRWSVSAK